MVKIRKFKKSDLIEISLLVARTFKKFNSRDYFNKEGVEYVLDFYNPRKNSKYDILRKFEESTIFYVAISGKKVIGMIKGGKNKIGSFFVKSKYHKKGVGRRLVEEFEKEAVKLGSNKIKINSSLYAIPFYTKMGYKKSTGIRNFHGLKVQPMKKYL